MLGAEIKTKFEADQPLSADAAFMTWIADLEKVMEQWGTTHGDGSSPYTLPLHEGTGLECWHDMYSEGFTPKEAFEEDRSNWI